MVQAQAQAAWLWLAATWWGRILSVHDTEPSELHGGISKIAIGSQLLLPYSTFAGAPAVYRDFMAIPEPVWGIAFLVAGVGHLAAIRRGARGWRAASSAIGFAFWLVLAFLFFHANAGTLGGVLALGVAAEQGWCYYRLRGRT
jgi:hypothetical protein